MHPIERLGLAIGKLERLRDERGYSEYNGWLIEYDEKYDEPSPITNDEFMLVLHRTIDAQLAVLRLGVDTLRAWQHAIDHKWVSAGTAARGSDTFMALANAIIGPNEPEWPGVER